MTYSHLDPAMQNRVVWNAGKNVGTKRPLTQKQIWAIRFFLDREERLCVPQSARSQLSNEHAPICPASR